jgi:hypothetical protein
MCGPAVVEEDMAEKLWKHNFLSFVVSYRLVSLV